MPVMPNMILSVLLLFSTHIYLALSLDCYPAPARTSLPVLDHCKELVWAITYASRLPHRNDPKEWGRGLRTTDMTEYLPKRYWLPQRGDSTCALIVDADPLFPNARE
ncbi:MAG: hypothetical protein Q9222_003127, partial [Ikaeria aurantiellina]